MLTVSVRLLISILKTKKYSVIDNVNFLILEKNDAECMCTNYHIYDANLEE